MSTYTVDSDSLKSVANSIRTKGGTTANLSFPSGFVTAINAIQTANPNKYAQINVIYPAGSTCTCTKGSTVLPAENKLGVYTFNLPSSGTWTVTATDGTNTKSKAVSITAQGQTESFELFYFRNIYRGSFGQAGETGANLCTDLTGGWENIGIAINANVPGAAALNIEYNADHVYLKQPYSACCGMWKTKAQIDFSKINTLTVELGKCNDNGDYTVMGVRLYPNIGSNTDQNLAAEYIIKNGSGVVADGTVGTIDTSAMAGKYYVSIFVYNVNAIVRIKELYGTD